MEVLGTLGEGSFGKVVRVRIIQNPGDTCADHHDHDHHQQQQQQLPPYYDLAEENQLQVNDSELSAYRPVTHQQHELQQVELACKIFLPHAGADEDELDVDDDHQQEELVDIKNEVLIMQTILKAGSSTSTGLGMPDGLVRIHGFHLGSLTSPYPLSFITMDLCEGGSLSDFLKTRPSTQAAAPSSSFCSEEEAALILGIVARALLFCHIEARILHRDIKPANILLGERGRLDSVRLADFGLSVHMPAQDRHRSSACTDIVYGPPGVGSLDFMAPEAEKQGCYSPASDVWSLGAVVFRMLCGANPPRPCYGIIEHDDGPSLKKAADALAALSSPARSLVQGMLCIDPDRRLTLWQVLQHPWTLAFDEKFHEQRQQQAQSLNMAAHLGAACMWSMNNMVPSFA